MKEKSRLDHAAIATGLFPDITARALKDRRLGKVVNGEEYADRRILTLVEEAQLAEWIKGENTAQRLFCSGILYSLRFSAAASGS